MAELVDVLDLGSSAVRRGGSSPFTRTFLTSTLVGVFFGKDFTKETINAGNDTIHASVKTLTCKVS